MAWLDFDDVRQTILLHIHEKWYQWNQALPLEPWLNRLITNQLRNISRNVYKSSARPCLDCAKNEGGDLCALTPSGKQCGECPIYKAWEKKKKSAHDIRLAVSIEDKGREVFSLPEESADIEAIAQKIHGRVPDVLSEKEMVVYKALFIDFLTEEDTAKLMGYRTSERNRKAGYRRIKQIRRKIMEKVKKISSEYF